MCNKKSCFQVQPEMSFITLPARVSIKNQTFYNSDRITGFLTPLGEQEVKFYMTIIKSHCDIKRLF